MLSTDLQIVLRERYEQSHGIFDHAAAQNDHFALVRHHWSEDNITSSRLRERMEAFLDARVGERFHLSFAEFIEQPSYVCDLQLEVLEQRAPAQEEELRKLAEEFNSSSKK